jgi:hypothetical protein
MEGNLVLHLDPGQDVIVTWSCDEKKNEENGLKVSSDILTNISFQSEIKADLL